MQADDETIDEIIEVDFPLYATLIGVGVEVRLVDFDGDERRGLVAVIPHGSETHRVSLLDLVLPTGPALLLTNAYRRWLGIS